MQTVVITNTINPKRLGGAHAGAAKQKRNYHGEKLGSIKVGSLHPGVRNNRGHYCESD
jgi:hypothetical protein